MLSTSWMKFDPIFRSQSPSSLLKITSLRTKLRISARLLRLSILGLPDNLLLNLLGNFLPLGHAGLELLGHLLELTGNLPGVFSEFRQFLWSQEEGSGNEDDGKFRPTETK